MLPGVSRCDLPGLAEVLGEDALPVDGTEGPLYRLGFPGDLVV